MNSRALHPLHSSIDKRRYVQRAYGMETFPCTNEQREAMERIALEIFTDMTNAGAPFQQTLAAIYVSGLQHAVHILGNKT